MSNIIHPTAIIGDDVELGSGNEIGAYSIIYGPTIVGNNNIISPHVTIGTPGQDTRNPRYDSSNCKIEIGNNNIIREYTAIQKPCYRDLTKIGSDVYIMQSVHVPHDALICDKVVITPMVVLGGIVRLLTGANLAVGCSVHQYSVIGHYSIVGMGSALTRNIKPFSKFIARMPLSVNDYAIEKFGFEDIKEEIYAYVLDGVDPVTPKLKLIVEEFNVLHAESGRKLFGDK